MKLSTILTLAAAVAGTTYFAADAKAAVELVDADGWQASVDGRVNAFVTHTFGDERPEETGANWIGFNESDINPSGNIRRTRIRSGMFPSFIGFNFKKTTESLTFSSRVEVGFQITNTVPSASPDLTEAWIQPRNVWLDVAGDFGSLRAGRSFGLFGRSNIVMNVVLGQNYGVGFPCANFFIQGGSCGHVGYGVIWPDFTAQISYATPKIADSFQFNIGVFDPRSAVLAAFEGETFIDIELPRFEAEATFDIASDGFSLKAWAGAFWQRVGATAEVTQVDPLTGETIIDPISGDDVTAFENPQLDSWGVGGGVMAEFGDLSVGLTGHTGAGLDAFIILPFNPVIIGTATEPDVVPTLRDSIGYLAMARYNFGDAWISLGYGQALLDRVDGDPGLTVPDQNAVLREQTGISAGIYYRVGQVIFGIDFFNADYKFDDRVVTDETGLSQQFAFDPNLDENVPVLVEPLSQNINFLSAGVTMEW